MGAGKNLSMPQLLCDYYGTALGGAEAARLQIEAAKGVEGVLGMIYGPWCVPQVLFESCHD